MAFNSIGAITKRMAAIQAEISELQSLKKQLPGSTVTIIIEPQDSNRTYVLGNTQAVQNSMLQIAAAVSLINAGVFVKWLAALFFRPQTTGSWALQIDKDLGAATIYTNTDVGCCMVNL